MATPLGRSFTHQGQLMQPGVPVDGTTHLRFSLWDAAGTGDPPTGGTQIGSSQIVADVVVDDGLFTAVVNAGGEFGASAFIGDARWLQVEVCTDGTCASSTVLGPRQPLTAAPYALGPWQLSGTNLTDTGGKVGIGTTSPAHMLHSIVSGRLQMLATAPDSTLDIRGDLFVHQNGTLEADPAGPEVARVRFTASTVQNVNLLGSVILGVPSDLEVVNPVAVLLGSDPFSQGSMKLSGSRLPTGVHLLHLGHTGTVTGPYWVDGNLGQILPGSAGTVAMDFRVGDSNRAAPVTLAFASVGDTGTVVVRTDSGHHVDLAASALDPDQSVNRTWTVTNLGMSFTTCDATFSFQPDDIDPGADPNLFRVGRRESGVWSLPAIGARTATSTQATALTSFGEFAVGEPEGSLAVDDAPPSVTALAAARPSPFRTNVALDFSLARAGEIEHSIFDVSGRRMRVLDQGVREPGRYHAVWDGRDDEHTAVPMAAYFARLVTGDGTFHRKRVRVQ